MDKKKGFWNKYGRLIVLIGLLVLAVILIWAVFGDIFPLFFRLLRDGDEAAIESYIGRTALWKGILSIMSLSAIQVISIVFPGFAIQIAAGAIYGWWPALLMCYSGFLIGNAIVFTVARRMGSEIRGFAPKRSAASEWVRDKLKTTRPSFVVALLNLIPLIPNGIVPYMAAGSSISFPGFLGAIAATSWVQILINCVAGGFLKRGHYLFMVIALSAQVGLVVLVTWKRKWVMSLIPGGADRDDEDEIEEIKVNEAAPDAPDSSAGGSAAETAEHVDGEQVKAADGGAGESAAVTAAAGKNVQTAEAGIQEDI